MIQLGGKMIIKRYLAQQIPAIAQTIALGVGAKAEANTDTYMQFEVERVNITLVSYDFTNNKLIFKATLPADFAGRVYEVGLYSLQTNPASGNFGSKMLITFDSDAEDWLTGTAAATFSNTYARIGADALSHVATTSTSVTSTLNSVDIDVSGNSGADLFLFAFNNVNSNTASVTVRFKVDSANYYTLSINSPTVGYNIYSIAKASAVATGAPSWSGITSVEIVTTAKSTGNAVVDWDGIRIEDIDSVNPDYALVSRELLSPFFTATQGMTQEIEFSLDVNV